MTKWWNRLNRRNENLLLSVVGGTGIGKSYTAIFIAMKLNPKRFDVRKHVVFRAKDFMELLNNGNLKRGDVIIWDEAGVEMGSRDWYSISNKMINYVLQTFRHKNIGVIFTVPDFNFIDSQARKLFHATVEVLYKDKAKKRCMVKVMTVEPNPYTGEIYRKYYRWKGGALKQIWIPMIPKETRKIYEPNKKLFTATLNKDVKEKIELKEEKLKPQKTDEEILKEIEANPDLFIGTWNGEQRFLVPKIVAHIGDVSYNHARLIATKANETLKGFLSAK